MKKILQKLLAFLAKAIIRKYQPKIIGITGSVGKSSTKEAIYAAVRRKFRARTSINNYNNEIGVPLTIINAAAGGRSPWQWLSVFVKALKLLIGRDKNYPELLILEYGADRPGDIEYLVKNFPCNIGVATKVAPAHIEYFGTLEEIAREKRKIASHLNKDGAAILNHDDELVLNMQKQTKAKVLTFGYSAAAGVRALELEIPQTNLVHQGLRFKIMHGGSSVPFFVPGVFGRHQVYAILAAAAVGLSLGMNLVEISEQLRDYKPPNGRMNVIKGIKNSIIIDDTYNSSPAAALAALDAVSGLELVQAQRRVAVLGDMLELGASANQEHYELGRRTAESGYDLLAAVGKYKDKLAQGAKDNGLNNILKFDDSVQAAAELTGLILDSDVILVKGSQGARMERVVKALMAEPDQASKLLVRQSNKWLAR